MPAPSSIAGLDCSSAHLAIQTQKFGVILQLADRVLTLGRFLKNKYGYRVHKLSINAGFTCPNLDGSKAVGGCTFCNNASFTPVSRRPPGVAEQIRAGKAVIVKRTGAMKYLAYFQAYTNTYADVKVLRALYDEALKDPDVVGLSVGTRPDCVSGKVLDLLLEYRSKGYEVWLELGLQSAFDEVLRRVNRGHGFAEYEQSLLTARARGLQVCTHLIVGLPGESAEQSLQSLDKVLALGVDGLKIHPLHVVRGTLLAKQWRRGEYGTLSMNDYVETVINMIRRTPEHVVFHRLTATAEKRLLLAPAWCERKWPVLNAIAERL